MSNYTGYRCPVCGKAFLQEDDVVVCPDCGTPHHRECYRSLGHCAYEEKHAAGEQWSPGSGEDGEHPPRRQAAILCPRCGSHNPAGNIFCQVCGQQLTAGQAPGAPFPGDAQQGYRSAQDNGPASGGPQDAGTPPPWVRDLFTEMMEEPEIAPGISNREVCDYVGPNGLVFLVRFQRLLRSGARISVNWCAFFFSFLYCFYRKMYKMGAVLLGITIAAMIPMLLAFIPLIPTCSEMLQQGTLTIENLNALLLLPAAQPFVLASNVSSFVQLAIRFFCGFFFNPAYCKQVCRGIQTVRERGHFSSGSPEYRYALIRQGGVNVNAVLVAVCSLMVLYILGVYLILGLNLSLL